jgi:Protein of unknown function (DUF4235)
VAIVVKLAYKPIGLVVGVLGGLLATAVFNKLWGLLAPGDEAPDATDARATWRQVLLAAAIQGAVFGGVKALVDRAGAHGYQKVTGTWPGTGNPDS